jgi:hypothetical protein
MIHSANFHGRRLLNIAGAAVYVCSPVGEVPAVFMIRVAKLMSAILRYACTMPFCFTEAEFRNFNPHHHVGRCAICT